MTEYRFRAVGCSGTAKLGNDSVRWTWDSGLSQTVQEVPLSEISSSPILVSRVTRMFWVCFATSLFAAALGSWALSERGAYEFNSLGGVMLLVTALLMLTMAMVNRADEWAFFQTTCGSNGNSNSDSKWICFARRGPDAERFFEFVSEIQAAAERSGDSGSAIGGASQAERNSSR